MRNVQIIDGADNATFSIFQATDEEFAAIFPDDRDMELVEDFFERMGEEHAISVLTPIWGRPIRKREALGIHGTLFYDNWRRRASFPPSKREVDWVGGAYNHAQETLFTKYR